MTAEQAELVAELNRRFSGGDREGAAELLHPELRIVQPASLPHGGEHRGLDGTAAMGATFAEHWTRTIEPPEIFDAGELVVQLTHQRWTAIATGRSADVDVVELFRFADGLIAEIRVFQEDTHRLLATLDEPDG